MFFPKKTKTTLKASLAVGATALLMMVGCGKEDEENEEEAKVEATFSSLNTHLFTACTQCHGVGNGEVAAVLANDIAISHTGFTATEIVFSENATGQADTCAGGKKTGLKIVTPGNVNTSLILALVDSNSRDAVSTAVGCGVTNTHHTDGTISGLATAEVIAALKKWISEGAKNN